MRWNAWYPEADRKSARNWTISPAETRPPPLDRRGYFVSSRPGSQVRSGLAAGGGSLERTRLWTQIPCYLGKYREFHRFLAPPPETFIKIPLRIRPLGSNSLCELTGKFSALSGNLIGLSGKYPAGSGNGAFWLVATVLRSLRRRTDGTDVLSSACCREHLRRSRKVGRLRAANTRVADPRRGSRNNGSARRADGTFFIASVASLRGRGGNPQCERG
jgi:hypothetical protein